MSAAVTACSVDDTLHLLSVSLLPVETSGSAVTTARSVVSGVVHVSVTDLDWVCCGFACSPLSSSLSVVLLSLVDVYKVLSSV